jgi:16S rRNA (guanine527-N7)-methyltransferase
VNSHEFQDRLASRARSAAVNLPPELGGQLETYYRLLLTWNRRINLTGMDLSDAAPEAIDRLLIEPIVAASHVTARPTTMIDIGSGGGSPAIPFALAVPGVRLSMVESKTRKAIFLKEVARALGMQAEVLTTRFEALPDKPELHETHDLLTVRAVRVDRHLLTILQALVRPDGQMLLFRSMGADITAALPRSLTHVRTIPLLESRGSSLVVLSRNVSRGT